MWAAAQHWLNDNSYWVVPTATLLTPTPVKWRAIGVNVVAYVRRVATVQNIVGLLKKAIPLIIAATMLAEAAMDGKDGSAKKAEVIGVLKDQFPKVAAEMAFPAWLVTLLTDDATLGMLIDLAVYFSNKSGVFDKPTPV